MTVINFLLKCKICIFSELIILTLFLVSGFYFPAISGWLFLSILILPLSSLMYIKLYTWHKLSMSNFSFLRFMLILIQGLLFLISIYFIVFKTIRDPIYIENLSTFSQYKYLFFCVIAIFVIVLLLISFLFNYNISSWFSFLNLQEEMRAIFLKWHESIFAPSFSNLIDKMDASRLVLLSYFIIDFSLFYIIRFIILIYFLKFIYFNGDLRIVLYFVPVSFIIWLLSFLRDYFLTFRQETFNYIFSLVRVSAIDKTAKANLFGLINLQSGALFTLTEEAMKTGFTEEDISHLSTEWFLQASLAAYFDLYFKIMRHIGFLFLFLRIIAWFSIVDLFFNIKQKVMFSGLLAFFKNAPFYHNSFQQSRNYATEICRVRKLYQKQMAQATDQTHSGNHLALVDKAVRNPDNPAEVLYEGQPTHGAGTKENPSVLLHPSKDISGQQIPQRVVIPPNRTYIPEPYVDPSPVPTSKAFLNEPEVKANLAKHAKYPEDT